MKSGTEKNPNPHEVSLAKFLGARAAHVTTGYLGLRTGQIVRQDTWDRWVAEGRVRGWPQ